MLQRKWLVLIIVCAGAPACLHAAAACKTVEQCVALYPAVSSDGRGISEEQKELAEKLQGFGADALPHLLPLLDHENQGVRNLVGYTLLGVRGFVPEHLHALIRANNAGVAWLPGSIARIGTPEAISYLVDEMQERPENSYQTVQALASLGRKSAPHLLALFDCHNTCNEHALEQASRLLGQMARQWSDVLPKLMSIASNTDYPLLSRQSAIRGIGSAGPIGVSYAPKLVALKQQSPLLQHVVNRTLIDIQSPEVVPYLVEQLDVHPEYALDALARLGTQGIAAGPDVMAFMHDDDWGLRLTAVETLGTIGYLPAVSALIDALSDPYDWKLVYGASIALSRLGSTQALPVLQETGVTHWYPPVRDMAQAAAKAIQSNANVEPELWWSVSALDGSPKACLSTGYAPVQERSGSKLYAKTDHERLSALAYPESFASERSSLKADPHGSGVTRSDADRADDQNRRQVQRTPSVGLNVGDGWLVGTDHGEWGGELMYLRQDAEPQLLARENIADLFVLGEQYVAVAGLAHMIMNNGLLLRLIKNDAGGFSADPWIRLPAAPVSSRRIQNGSLLVHTQGGSVLIDPTGAIRMAKCR